MQEKNFNLTLTAQVDFKRQGILIIYINKLAIISCIHILKKLHSMIANSRYKDSISYTLNITRLYYKEVTIEWNIYVFLKEIRKILTNTWKNDFIVKQNT